MAASVTIKFTLDTATASRKLSDLQTQFKGTMTGILADARESAVGLEGLFNALRFDARGITGPADASIKSLGSLADQAKVTRESIAELTGSPFSSSKTVTEAQKATDALREMKAAGAGGFGGGGGSSRQVRGNGESGGGGESGGSEGRAGISDVFGAYADLSVIIDSLRGAGDIVRTGADIQNSIKMLYATAGEKMPEAQFTQQLESQANRNNVLPSDAAKAAYPVESAGFRGGDALTVLNNSEKLTVGTQSELADSTELLTKTLVTYRQTALDSAKDSDEYTRAITDSLVAGKSFVPAMDAVLDVGKHAGLSLAELSSGLAVLSSQTKSAATASTFLRAFLSALIDPTKATRDAAKEAGLGWLAQGRALEEIKRVGFAGVLQEINQACNGNSEAFGKLFSDMRKNQAVFGLLNDGGIKYIRTFADVRNSSGATESAVKKMDTSLSVLGTGFESRVQTLDSTLTGDLDPALVTAGSGVETLLDAFNSMDPVTRRIIEGVLITGAALLGTAAAVRLIATTWKALYGPEVAGAVVKLIGGLNGAGTAAAKAGTAGAEAQASIGGAAERSAGQVQGADAKIVEANESVTASAKEAASAQAGIGEAAEGAAAKTEASAAAEATAAEGAQTALEGAGTAEGTFLTGGAEGLAATGPWGLAAAGALVAILAIGTAWEQAQEKQKAYYDASHTGDPKHDLQTEIDQNQGQINQIAAGRGGRSGDYERSQNLKPLKAKQAELNNLKQWITNGDTGAFDANIARVKAERDANQKKLDALGVQSSKAGTSRNGTNRYTGQMKDIRSSIAGYNATIARYQEFRQSAEVNRNQTGGTVASQVVESAIANSSAAEIANFSQKCQAWVRTAISKVPAANAQLSKYFRGSALQTMEAFQKAGIGHAYKTGEVIPPGALLYSGRMGHGNGHAAIEGATGVLGTAPLPNSKLDWIVVPGSDKGGGSGLPYASGSRPKWLGSGGNDNDSAAVDAASAAVARADGDVAAANAAVQLCNDNYARTGNQAFLILMRAALRKLRDAQIKDANDKLAAASAKDTSGKSPDPSKIKVAQIERDNEVAGYQRDYASAETKVDDSLSGTPAQQRKSAGDIVIAGLQRQISIKDASIDSYTKLLDQGMVSDSKPLASAITDRYALQKQVIGQQYDQQRAENPSDTKALDAQEQVEQSKLYLDYQKQIASVGIERESAIAKQFEDQKSGLEQSKQALQIQLQGTKDDAQKAALRKQILILTMQINDAQRKVDLHSPDAAVRKSAGDRMTLANQGAVSEDAAATLADTDAASERHVAFLKAEAEATQDLSAKVNLLTEAYNLEIASANRNGDKDSAAVLGIERDTALKSIRYEQDQRSASNGLSALYMENKPSQAEAQAVTSSYLALASDVNANLEQQQEAVSQYLELIDSLFRAHLLNRTQLLADIQALRASGAPLSPDDAVKMQSVISDSNRQSRYSPQTMGGAQWWGGMRDSVGDAVAGGLENGFKGSHKLADDFGKALLQSGESSLEKLFAVGSDNLLAKGSSWLMSLFKSSGGAAPAASANPAASMATSLATNAANSAATSALTKTATQAVAQTAAGSAAQSAAAAGTQAGMSALSAAVPWIAGAAVLSNPAAVKAIGDAIAGIEEAEGKAIEDVGQGIGDAAKGIGEGAGDLMSGAGKGIHNIISAFTGADAPRITTQTVENMHNDMVIVGASPLQMLTGSTGGGLLGGLLGGISHLLHFSEGGWVPGNGNRDTIPAMLTPGEFVVSKRMMMSGASGIGRLLRAPISHLISTQPAAPSEGVMGGQALGYLRQIAGKLDRPNQQVVHNYAPPRAQSSRLDANHQRSLAVAR